MWLKKRVDELEKILLSLSNFVNTKVNRSEADAFNKRLFVLEQEIRSVKANHTVCDKCKIIYEREKRPNQDVFLCIHCQNGLKEQAPQGNYMTLPFVP